jgi:hypothetical protein
MRILYACDAALGKATPRGKPGHGSDVLRFSCLRYRVVVVVAELSRTLNAIERLCSVRLGLLLPR